MSLNYAAALSKYPNKGVVGLPEVVESSLEIEEKVDQLCKWIQSSKHIVVHTGAGISTAAGRPNGVWTAEKKKKSQPTSIPFMEAVPTFSHMALKHLVELDIIKFIVSQNIDGLHLRSGLDSSRLAELHGNFFLEECTTCHALILRSSPVENIGQKLSGSICVGTRPSGKICRGRLKDTILDWEGNLPEADLQAAEAHSRAADLNIVLGSTLQIVPAGEFPMQAKRLLVPNARFVLVNLQKTKFDQDADLVIKAKIDDVFRLIITRLGISVPAYDPKLDPVRNMNSPRALVPLNRNLILPFPQGELNGKRKRCEKDTVCSKLAKTEPVVLQCDEKPELKTEKFE